MEQNSPVLVILSDESERPIGNQLANLLGYPFAHIVIGTGADAAQFIQTSDVTPRYIAMFIGNRRDEVMEELDQLAGHCMSGTQLVVAGETNDIQFYRALVGRGVIEYFPLPVDIDTIAKKLISKGTQQTSGDSFVVSFMSAAAGDGSSTIALNTAHAFAKEHGARTVIVDMDYQFGMISKNLDLTSPYGIKDLFEHPDRGIDSTLLERMAVNYDTNLDVIAAPNELKFQPDLQPEVIRDLVLALQEKYQYIIIDLPHIWSPWIAAAFNYSNAIILVSQLWLKSVTHASRLLNVWREMGISTDQIQVAINRSGAKYKEAVTQKDFERVCNKQVSYFLPNDIKTIVNAENLGKTVLELGKSKLASEFGVMANSIKLLKDAQTDGTIDPSKRLAFVSPASNRMS